MSASVEAQPFDKKNSKSTVDRIGSNFNSNDIKDFVSSLPVEDQFGVLHGSSDRETSKKSLKVNRVDRLKSKVAARVPVNNFKSIDDDWSKAFGTLSEDVDVLGQSLDDKRFK